LVSFELEQRNVTSESEVLDAVRREVSDATTQRRHSLVPHDFARTHVYGVLNRILIWISFIAGHALILKEGGNANQHN
jgi:hypothetical protein